MAAPLMSPARLLAFAMMPLLSGCYPLHATLGHLELMSKRQDVSDIVSDKSAAVDLKSHLARVAAIREFASRELQLPDNGSYRSYARLDQDYPVWNVWITPEFDLTPRQSCFPIVGCVPYRGYYSRQQAEDYADAFIEAGDDVLVGGVTAYSTLGFFDDPVTSTMLRLPEERLAGLIFHELAHQVVYVKNNATFNESFARAVEIEGTLRWLESRKDMDGLARYKSSLERSDIFFDEVRTARKRLGEMYKSDGDPAAKRLGKEQIFEDMHQAQQHRKTKDPAWSVYDPWFAESLNNAKLTAVATYYEDVAMFREMLRKAGGDFSAFYASVQLRAAQQDKSPRVPA